MDIERACIAKILVEDQLVAALQGKLIAGFFEKPDNRRAFEWMVEYYGRYGAPPTVDAFKVEYPNYKLPRTDEPLEYLIDQLREQRRFILLQDTLLDISEIQRGEGEGSIDDAIDRVAQFLSLVSAETSTSEDINLITTWATRVAAYRVLRKGGGAKGVPTGVPSFDASFGGFRPEQLITVIGEPKAGKSMWLLNMAYTAHAAGYVPMFIGFEMSNQEQAARHDALVAGLAHEKILLGKITLDETKKLKRMLRERENMHPFLLSSDIGTATTVSGLRAKIEQYHPSILFVDGVYLMDDELGADRDVETSRHLTNITRSLKRLAQTAKIPIVCSTQVLTWKISRRSGLTANTIGYTSSFAQDSDIIIGVEKIEGDVDRRKLKVILSRISAPMETNIIWDWAHSNFTEIGFLADDGGFEVDEEDEGVRRAQGRI